MNTQMRPLLAALPAALLLIALFGGCGSDDPAAPEPPPSPNTPDMPVPSSLNENMHRSSELELSVAQAENFTPIVTGCGEFLDRLKDYDLRYDYRVTLDRRYRLVDDGEVIDPWLDLEYRVNEPGREWHDLAPVMTYPAYLHLGQIGEKHYYVSRNRCKWHMASTTAQMAGGHLAAFHDQATNDSVMTLAMAAGYDQNLLIGLHQYYGPAQWSNGDPLDWENWDTGEPSHGSEDYIEIQAPRSNNRHGSWNDTRHFALRYVFMSTERIPDPEPDTWELAFRGNRYDPSPNEYSYVYLFGAHRITNPPYLKKVCYWDPVYQFALSPDVHFSQGFEYWQGVVETQSSQTMSFGLNLGLIEADYPDLGDWQNVDMWVDFLTDINLEFEMAFSSASTSLERGERNVYSYETAMPADRSGKLVFWQLRERVYVVDAEGEPWTDPAYEITDMPYLDYATNNFNVQLTYFPAP